MFIIEKGTLTSNAIRPSIVWHFVTTVSSVNLAFYSMQWLPRRDPTIHAMRVLDMYTGKTMVSAQMFDPIPIASLQDAVALNRL